MLVSKEINICFLCFATQINKSGALKRQMFFPIKISFFRNEKKKKKPSKILSVSNVFLCWC